MDDRFEREYNQAFAERWEFERTPDGVLTVKYKQVDESLRDEEGYSISRFAAHSDGPVGPVLQRSEPVWSKIASDDGNKVVILTGYDGDFYDSHDMLFRQGFWNGSAWSSTLQHLPRALNSFLDLPTLTIGAAVGLATVHAEFLLLCDMVVAGESAVFQDKAHFISNTVPGDGVNVVWPFLLGWNRGRDFLLTGRKIGAQEALELGLVREVVPDADVLPRCKELARDLLKQDDLTIRMTARILRQQIKAQLASFVPYALAVEGIVFIDQSSRGPR